MVSARGGFASGPPKAWDASFWYLTFHSRPPKVLEAHSAPNAFRRQHFGIVRGRCFAWFGHESCCCSAVSEAVGQRLWTLVFDVWHFIAARQRFWKLIQHFWHESCCCSAVSQAVRQRLGTLVFDAFRRQRFGKFLLFAWSLFRMVSARILLLFGGFASGPPKAWGASSWYLTFHSRPPKVLEAHSAPNAFRRQHFGIVRGRCFAWFRHAAVSQAVRQRLGALVLDIWHFIAVRQRFWKLIQLLMRFVGNILALFVVAVLHGLDTNPAAVRLFRKRLAKGFGR